MPLLAALSMVGENWSSTARPVRRPSASDASREVHSKHHSHDYEELSEVFERYKQETVSPIEKQLEILEKALAQLDTRHAEISKQQMTVEAKIHSTITKIQETLEVRKTELIGQLHQLTQAKLKSLAIQRDQLEATQAQLSSYLHFIKENLKTVNQSEVLLMKKTTVELATTFQLDTLKPNTEVNIIFSTLSDLAAECQSYGKVHTASPQKSIEPAHPKAKSKKKKKSKKASTMTTAGGLRYQRLLCEFIGQSEDELSCKMGEEVEVLEDIGNGWLRVCKKNDKDKKEGHIPRAYISQNPL